MALARPFRSLAAGNQRGESKSTLESQSQISQTETPDAVADSSSHTVFLTVNLTLTLKRGAALNTRI